MGRLQKEGLVIVSFTLPKMDNSALTIRAFFPSELLTDGEMFLE
jgi:hypothetical protein